MKLAIMQPYAFPYLGYFQLMRAADRFVLLDDVTFIKQGWVNRNRILGPHGPLRFTLPIEGASSNRRLCDLQLVEGARWRDRLLRTIEQSYRRAPGFARTLPVVERALRHPDRRLNAWLRHSLECLTEALAIQTPLVSAAEFHPAAGARGLHRLLEICRREGATDYLNAEGGRALYDPAAFSAQGLRLHFVEHIPRPYPQRGGPFVDRLSIIDALMWNNPASLERLLGDCLLVPARATESGGVRPPAAPS
jgi:hypothetical protein